jgi:hypothetical protein
MDAQPGDGLPLAQPSACCAASGTMATVAEPTTRALARAHARQALDVVAALCLPRGMCANWVAFQEAALVPCVPLAPREPLGTRWG